MIQYFELLLCAMILLNGCQVSTQKNKPFLSGIYDGKSYTSASGALTVYLQNANPQSIQADIDEHGTQERFSFSDKQGGFYGILITRAREGLHSDFLDKYLEENEALRAKAIKQKTPDGLPCISAIYFQADENTEKGWARVQLIFTRPRTIFEVLVVSRPAETPEATRRIVNQAIYSLWRDAVFRAVQDQDINKNQAASDPRLPIILTQARRAAHEVKFNFSLQRKTEYAWSISLPGSRGEMILGIALSRQGREILYAETVSCHVQDKSAALQMRNTYFMVFERMVAEEKLSVRRKTSPEVDT